MAPLENRKPSIKFIHSFYSGERKIFSCLTSSLEIDGDLAFKIISYWLWLEENISKDLIHAIQPLSDDGLKRICSLGEEILTNAAESDSLTARKALSGVKYFLKAVCYKAMDDLKDRAEYENAKKVLQELDLEEFLCKPDPSLARLNLSSEDGTGGTSSVLRGMHMQLNKGQISHGGSTSQQTGIGKRFLIQPRQDCAQNSSQLSATAEAYYPRNASYTGFPGLIPASLVEHIILPNIPATFAESSTIVPLIPAFPPQRGAIVPYIPALAPQTCAVVPHILVFSSQAGAVLPQVHISALAQQTGADVFHVPVLDPQSRAVGSQIPARAPQSGAVISYIPASSPQSSAAVTHIPAVSMQSGAVVPFQNGTNVSQSPSGATGMILNTQNIIRPTPVLVTTGRHQPDERKLYVTFSNGSPLSADELVQFFVRYYNVKVESIYIEKPNTERPPKFGHVTFYHPQNVELVLAGKTTVKFRVNGKHVWARRFIPGRRRRG